MFFRSSKRQHQARQLRDWQQSAKKVGRAWNAWLAAEGSEREGRYGAYVAALNEEERAAAIVEEMFAGQAGDAPSRRALRGS